MEKNVKKIRNHRKQVKVKVFLEQWVTVYLLVSDTADPLAVGLNLLNLQPLEPYLLIK